MKSEKMEYYPLFLSVSGMKCVVVGGGKVALRKVRSLLDHGAIVSVISPECCPELKQLGRCGEVCIMNRAFQPGDLEGTLIAIASTDEHETNLRVAQEARERGILVNVVDDPVNSDFIVPSCLKRGEITIAISTAGLSPALARKIRSRLENEIGQEYASLVRMIGEVRREIKDKHIHVESEDWQKALDIDSLINLLKQGNKEGARQLLLDNLLSPG